MYVLPNATAFNTACAATTRDIYTKCEVYSSGTLQTTMVGSGASGEIMSFEWDNVVCSSEGFQIGTCCMDEFKMKYHPISTTGSLMGKELRPYIGVDVNGTVTYVPIGRFYVINTETQDEGFTYDVTAYDLVYKLIDKVDWGTLGVEFPVQAWTLLQAIANKFGFSISYTDELYRLLSSEPYTLKTSDNYTLVVQAATYPNKRASFEVPAEGTYRDYVGWIAGLVGANAHMGRTGDLVLARYADHGFSIGRNVQHLSGTRINFGGTVTYTSIISGTDNDPVYPTGYSGNFITYSNPYINSQQLTYVCDELLSDGGLTITPCDVTWRSNPCVDAGDIVSVMDKDDNSLSVYVMERVVKITGGLTEELHCYGATEDAQMMNISPMTTKLAQVTQEVRTFAELINGTQGTFQFIDNGDGTNGGFTIYESDGVAFLRCTAGGIGLSQDGGLTYTNAITKQGIIATELNIQRDGHPVLEVKDDSYSGLPIMEFNDADGDNIFVIKSYEYGSGSGKYGTALYMYDPDNGAQIFEITSLWSENPVRANGVGIELWDPTHTYRIFMSTGEDGVDLRLCGNGGYDELVQLGGNSSGGYIRLNNKTVQLLPYTTGGQSYWVLGVDQ